jgi:hypothetical protein
MLGLLKQLSGTALVVGNRVRAELRSKDKGGSREAFKALNDAARHAASFGRVRVTPHTNGNPEPEPDANHITWLDRPPDKATPKDLKVLRLDSSEQNCPSIEKDRLKVEFEYDLSRGGLNAIVTVNPLPTKGVYSGLVYAGEDPRPLGTLVIEFKGSGTKEAKAKTGETKP